MTKKEKAKVIRAAELIANKEEKFCCYCDMGAEINYLFSDFCMPRNVLSRVWFDIEDFEDTSQRQLARTLALLMWAETE